MRASWPSLRAERLNARAARWRGPLKPLLQTYEVQVVYQAPVILEVINPLKQQPHVRILSPRLRQRRADAEGDLPHVYWDDPDCPALCLFDHETGEWTPFHLLADTTIRWTIDWLTCYEGWRVTGEWTGGGRHAEPLPSQDSSP